MTYDINALHRFSRAKQVLDMVRRDVISPWVTFRVPGIQETELPIGVLKLEHSTGIPSLDELLTYCTTTETPQWAIPSRSHYTLGKVAKFVISSQGYSATVHDALQVAWMASVGLACIRAGGHSIDMYRSGMEDFYVRAFRPGQSYLECPDWSEYYD